MAKSATEKRTAETIVRKAFEEGLRDQPHGRYPVTMRAAWVATPLGTMLAVGNDDHLYLLSFMETANTERRAALISKRLKACLELGDSRTTHSIREELDAYFAGRLREFATPLRPVGTSFQLEVWAALRRVPYANTVSYAALAESIGRPTAFRAVALACGQNPIHIAIPCHRIVNADGGLGGYVGGLHRKRWLLDFEKEQVQENG